MRAFYSFLAAYFLSTALTNAAAIPPCSVLAPTSSVGRAVSKRNVYGSNIGKAGVQGITIEARAGDTTLPPDQAKRGKKRDRAHSSPPPDAQAQPADPLINLILRVSQLGFDQLIKERMERNLPQKLVNDYKTVVRGDLIKVASDTERDMEKTQEGNHSQSGSPSTSTTSSEYGFSDSDSEHEAEDKDTRTGKHGSPSTFERAHISPGNLEHALRYLDIAEETFVARTKNYPPELVEVILMGFAKEREELKATVHKEGQAEKHLKSD